MNDETWREVVGFEGSYEVSSQGRVRSVPRTITYSDGRRVHADGRILSIQRDPGGYRAVELNRHGMAHRRLVHRLVLEAFVGPAPAGTEGCHGDGDRANNDLTNLRWDTRSANARDRVRHGTDANGRKTHCPRGHLLGGVNNMPSKAREGKRSCLACNRARASATNQRREFSIVEADANYQSIMNASLAAAPSKAPNHTNGSTT